MAKAATSDGEPRSNAVDAEHLKAFVERVERIREEQKELSNDVADIYKEAKGVGVDVRALREVIRLRSKDPTELREHQDMVRLYLEALG